VHFFWWTISHWKLISIHSTSFFSYVHILSLSNWRFKFLRLEGSFVFFVYFLTTRPHRHFGSPITPSFFQRSVSRYILSVLTYFQNDAPKWGLFNQFLLLRMHTYIVASFLRKVLQSAQNEVSSVLGSSQVKMLQFPVEKIGNVTITRIESERYHLSMFVLTELIRRLSYNKRLDL
jgi:hypothetical protein